MGCIRAVWAHTAGHQGVDGGGGGGGDDVDEDDDDAAAVMDAVVVAVGVGAVVTAGCWW